MDCYLAAAKAICDNYDLHGYRESDFDPVRDIAETIAGCDADTQVLSKLRALLPQSGYQIIMKISSVRIECLEPQKLFDLLISIRDGGAK